MWFAPNRDRNTSAGASMPGKGVRPHIGALAHKCLIGLVVVCLEAPRGDLHAVTAVSRLSRARVISPAAARWWTAAPPAGK